jgi:antirestriction protein ArdC
MNYQNIIAEITKKITKELEKGIVPWKKSWKEGIPANLITKKYYTGINFLTLITNEYPSQYYLTYLQCKEKNGRIKNGEKGHIIVYYSIKEITNQDNEIIEIPVIRYSYVFNISQTNLYEDKTEELKLIECENIIKQIKEIRITNNTISCYYNKRDDYISIPTIEKFESKEEYYSTLFHEIIHWTGHKERLNRKGEYAYEELIAEIGSAYLCGITGISNQTIDNQTSYINSWLKMINDNPKILIKASAEAQKAINYIINQNKE